MTIQHFDFLDHAGHDGHTVLKSQDDSNGSRETGDRSADVTRAQLAEAQFEAVAELADVGVVVFNASGGIRLINDRFVKLIGMEQAAVADKQSWTDLGLAIANRFRDSSAFLERWRSRMEHFEDASWDQLDLLRPPGGTIERFGRPLFGPAAQPFGRIEIYRDVSTKQMMERNLIHTNKLAGLGQLIAGIVHELNNPLTGILGYAQLLMSRALAPQPADDARQIFQEADRASRIIQNVLLFARETRGERIPVNLNNIAEHTVALRSHQLRLENIRMDLDLDPCLPFVIGDAGQLQQVAINLVINAEQAIGQVNSGGTIRLRTAALEDGRVRFEVSDTGPGIESDVLPNIFDPFFTTKASGMGTGLGLSVAFGIVQDHGGRLSAKSDFGRGAKFTIELAAAPVVQPVLAMSRPPRQRRSVRMAGTRPERILVIEDEPTVARYIADALGEDGHHVETILDSRQGLAKVLGAKYDLLICDLKMPYPDGRAVYEELSRRQNPLAQKIIFITGDTLATRTMDFLEFSGLPYLAKPFRVEDLKNAVFDLFAQARTNLPVVVPPRERRRNTGNKP